MRYSRFSLAIVIFISVVSHSSVEAQKRITFWTTEDQTERLELQKEIAHRFATRTGIFVNVVPVSENRIARSFSEAKTTHAFPDVLYHPLRFSKAWAKSGLLDVRAATQVVHRLEKETFCKGSLNLVTALGGYAAVPIDGWHQFLLYRKDLFMEKGLPTPDSWERILEAARKLHNAPQLWGVVLATDPNQNYTQQVFEHLALSNGVRLLDASGNVNLDTPEMVQTLSFYKILSQYSPGGNMTWQHTRKAYVSGHAAMIFWSSFILDELSGLRRDLPVIPDITKGEPGYLAKYTGFVSRIHGRNGVGGYSQISGLGVSKNGEKNYARRWVEFLLTDGYLNWLDIAPEGKMPMRLGSRKERDHFLKGWMELEIGVNIRAKISKFFGKEVMDSIINTTDEGFDQWGGKDNKCISQIYETNIIPKILKRFLDGDLSAEDTARIMNEQVKGFEK